MMDNIHSQYRTLPETREESKFGDCICGTPYEPVWFTEKEYGKNHFPTGRIRKNIDYFYCPCCGRTAIYDGESFAKPWTNG